MHDSVSSNSPPGVQVAPIGNSVFGGSASGRVHCARLALGRDMSNSKTRRGGGARGIGFHVIGANRNSWAIDTLDDAAVAGSLCVPQEVVPSRG